RRSVGAVLELLLKEYTLMISEAGTGKAAVDLVTESTFDLVLMDVRMPEMDGLDALKHIKELDPRTFVVIMTAHSNLQDAVTAIKCGAYDYIEKPVEPTRLAQIVKKAVETR